MVVVGLLAAAPASQAGDKQFAAERPMDLVHLKLDLSVDLAGEAVKGTATLELKALRDTTSVRLDAVDFEVSEVTVSRGQDVWQSAEYANDDESILITFAAPPLRRDDAVRVRIKYAVTKPKSGLHFFHPSEAEPEILDTLWSQGESVDARHWIPCFDHPVEMQTFEIVVTVPGGNEALSNGRLVSVKDDADGTATFHWRQDQPLPSYLITLVVSRFHVEQEIWRGKPVMYYVPPRYQDCVRNSFANTIRMLDHFSDITGVEYPWDKYAQVCAEHFGGGMEHTSATTMGTSTLHDDRAHIDTSSDDLIAHEMAHQWFGDLVTCRNWSHVWLNEGFASYFEAVWDDFNEGRDAYHYAMDRMARRALSAGRKKPILDREYDDPDEMFDGRAYPKGAWVLHMLRQRVGEDAFWRSVKRYLTDNRHQPVETIDLRKAFEAETGLSLERFFYDWVERPGHPELDVQYAWNDDEKTAVITVEQTQKDDPFEFPLAVEFARGGGSSPLGGTPLGGPSLRDGGGSPLRGETATEPVRFTRTINQRKVELSFPLDGPPRMVRIDPDNAVLKEMKEHKPRDLWAAQLTDDSNPAGRIAAVTHFNDEKDEKDDSLLIAALGAERFYGVAVEVIEALGVRQRPQPRDALLAALTHADPRLRRAAADELANFKDDPKVVEALKKRIEDRDFSYKVEAAAIGSYAELASGEGVADFLRSLLDRDSHDEVIRRAVLRGLGGQKDAAVLDEVLAWTERGKPNECRRAALQTAANLVRDAKLEGEPVERVVKIAVAWLDEKELRRNTWSAISILGDMGEKARSAEPALKALAENDRDERLRRSANRALESITGKRSASEPGSPPPSPPPPPPPPAEAAPGE